MITEAVLDAEYLIVPVQENMIPRDRVELPFKAKFHRVHVAKSVSWQSAPEWQSVGIAKRLVKICAFLSDRSDQLGIGANVLERNADIGAEVWLACRCDDLETRHEAIASVPV